MTHVLLKDDAANQRRMLMAMVGQLAAEVLKQSADDAIARIGRVGRREDFRCAVALISRTAKGDRAVRPASSLRGACEKMPQPEPQRKIRGSPEKAAAANERLVRVLRRAQRPLHEEFRAFWCHNAAGVRGMEWDEAIKRLADNGFTAIFPNMLWVGPHIIRVRCFRWSAKPLKKATIRLPNA